MSIERHVFVSQKRNSDPNEIHFERRYVSVLFTNGFEGTPQMIDNNEIFEDTSVVNHSVGDRLVIGVFEPLKLQKKTPVYVVFIQNYNIIEYCIQNITNRLEYSLDRPVSH